MTHPGRLLSAIALFALGFSGTWSMTRLTAPTICRDNCTGCDRRNTNFDENETCDGCKLRVWSEMTQHITDCKGIKADCSDTSCIFIWTLKYKTSETSSGDCDGHTWTWKRTNPVGSDRALSPSTNPVTIDTVDYNEPCDNWTQRTYTFTFDDSSCTSGDPPEQQRIELDEKIGCLECTGGS